MKKLKINLFFLFFSLYNSIVTTNGGRDLNLGSYKRLGSANEIQGSRQLKLTLMVKYEKGKKKWKSLYKVTSIHDTSYKAHPM
jgi:hypothetical protein